MSDSELLLWHEMGGHIPDNHPGLFKLCHTLKQVARENHTQGDAACINRAVAAVAARKAVG
jgi:hypothetical protein